jgi:Spy/CpxP family protein refolding chaperone
MRRTINFKMLLPILILLMTLPISPSFSQPPGMGRGMGMGMRPWKGEARCWKASDLNLSQEQMKGLDTLQQGFFRENQLLRAQIFSKRLELKELLTNSTTKIDSIRSKSTEISEHQAKLEEKSLEYLIKVRNLSQEQLKDWCPEMEFPSFRRMMQGPDSMTPSPPRKPPFQEGIKPE